MRVRSQQARRQAGASQARGPAFVRHAAGDEATVFRVAGVNRVGRLLEGRSFQAALDPAAVVGGRCDEQRCERYHAIIDAFRW